jgi:endo-1,4-beta-mannosidase
MISEVDIRDWERDEFLAICDAMPDEEKVLQFEQDGDDMILKMDQFLVNYGKALYRHWQKSLHKSQKATAKYIMTGEQMSLEDIFPEEFHIPSIRKDK